MKIVYFGGGDFAALVLSRLAAHHRLIAVVTPPPRPSGRKMRPMPTAAAVAAESLSLPVLHTPSPLDIQARAADVLVVCDYGVMLSAEMLSLSPLGALNIHPSVLPRWRGAAPIERAILAGDAMTGVTIIRLSGELDAGDILAQQQTPLSPTITGGDLRDALADAGATLLLRVLAAPSDFPPTKQDAEAVSYAAKIKTEERYLDFSQTAAMLLRRVRAFAPQPCAYASLFGERVKIHAASVVAATPSAAPGVLLTADAQQGIMIACGDGALRIDAIQRGGRRKMTAAEFLLGFPLTQHLHKNINATI